MNQKFFVRATDHNGITSHCGTFPEAEARERASTIGGEVIPAYEKTAIGLSWKSVAKAMDQSNTGGYHEDGIAAFLAEQGLDQETTVFMATHSWGGRGWKVVGGRNPAYYPDDLFGGGWYVFIEEDVTYLFCSSATSGSSLTAKRQSDGTWVLTLEVPIEEDGQPYQGHYWGCFHDAVGSRPVEEMTVVEG